MTENEKKLLQAKHRLEEAQMRDRVKERKARTHRLIQEGAILEKALPQTTQMTLEQLEDFYGKYSRQYDDFGVPGNRGTFLFPRRAHLLTTCKAGGGILPSGQARALFTNCLSAISPEGAGNAASGHSLCSRRYVLPNQ